MAPEHFQTGRNLGALSASMAQQVFASGGFDPEEPSNVQARHQAELRRATLTLHSNQRVADELNPTCWSCCVWAFDMAKQAASGDAAVPTPRCYEQLTSLSTSTAPSGKSSCEAL